MFKTSLLTCLCLFTSSIMAMEQVTPVEGSFLQNEQALPPIDSVINRTVPAFPVYGIYTWMGEYKMLRQQIKDVGWKTLRVSGPLNDDDLNLLFNDGLNFTFMLPGPKKDGKRAKRDHYENDQAYIDASIQAAHAFFDSYGENGSFYQSHPQHKDRYIPFMQIRNEPNFHYMYKKGSEAERQKLYANLAPQLADIIRKRSPKTKIIGFTAGGAGAGDLRFVKRVLELNASYINKIDAFSTHCYVQPAAPETSSIEKWGNYSIANGLHKLRKNFAQYNRADIPIWYTEGGWFIAKADGAAYDKPIKDCVSLELQAAYSCRYYAIAVRLGVDCVTNMFITDTDGYPGGFFDRLRDNKWRLSAKAVQNMIRLMPHPTLKEAQSDGTDGNYVYEFKSNALKKNTPTVIMAYRVQGPTNFDIAVKWSQVEIIDMLGNSTTVDAANGLVNCEIGPLPIYIREHK